MMAEEWAQPKWRIGFEALRVCPMSEASSDADRPLLSELSLSERLEVRRKSSDWQKSEGTCFAVSRRVVAPDCSAH